MSSAMGMGDESSGQGILFGDRVLVTGGSGGLGLGICKVAAREGAKVAFTWSSNADGAAQTEEQLQELGAEVIAIRADLRDPESPAQIVSEVESKWGGVDLLVNNAGVSEAIPFVLVEDSDLQEIMEVNFFAMFRLIREAARGMIRRKYGRIVNLSSIAGSRSIPGPAHYAASKGAVNGMTRSLAHELGPYGVLVNAVAAGIFEGGLKSTIPEHHQKRYLDSCSLGRVGKPDECGEFVAWLGSRRNTYVNGSVQFQDGGTLG